MKAWNLTGKTALVTGGSRGIGDGGATIRLL
jgi:NAD(P)-dependent dehydrogenase (short-subunit alcohol dehydrogenase family)